MYYVAAFVCREHRRRNAVYLLVVSCESVFVGDYRAALSGYGDRHLGIAAEPPCAMQQQ